jgi:transcription elongation factor Elf1
LITTDTTSNKRERERKGPYGEPLRCPGCDGFNFYIYRSNIHGDDEPHEIANCLDCNTATYVFAMKDRYHEDRGQDFKILDRTKHTIIFQCRVCGQQYQDDTLYEETSYDNTTYNDIDPEPSGKWRCSEHPNIPCDLLVGDF